MRYFGHAKTPPAPVNPDTIYSKKLTAATAEAADFPAGVDLFRVSFASTDLGAVGFLNIGSTKATVPTTAATQSTQNTTDFSIPIGTGDARVYQLARATTGFSFISPSSGYICLEFWRRNASTST